MTFCPPLRSGGQKKHPPFLQDFCKNAQWRAKKLRERGSNTARPTEKGIGGLPIGARFGRFRRVVSVVSCRFRRDLRTSSWRFGRFRRVVSVVSCLFGVLLVSRFGRFGASFRSRRSQGANAKKSPIPQSGNRAVAIARRRALLTFR